MQPQGNVTLAWFIVLALFLWSYAWKAIAFWKAARRDQKGWFVLIALLPPLAGAFEIFYVFSVAPRYEDLTEDTPF